MAKKLYSNFNSSNGCVVLMHTTDSVDVRFKITASIGNCYYRGMVQIQTRNGDWQPVINLEDTDVRHTCSYVSSETDREQSIRTVIDGLIKVLKKIY